MADAVATTLSGGAAITSDSAAGGARGFYYASITGQVEWANIRSGPSMEYEVLRAVPTGFPLLVLEQQDEWSKVEDYRKRKGWVANRLLAESKTVILKRQKWNLYNVPGFNEEIAAEIDYGSVMQIEEVRGEWLKVISREGAEGWLLKKGVWPGSEESGVRSED